MLTLGAAVMSDIQIGMPSIVLQGAPAQFVAGHGLSEFSELMNELEHQLNRMQPAVVQRVSSMNPCVEVCT
jgi:hypothetical protein